MTGNTAEVSEKYISHGSEDLAEAQWEYDNAPGAENVRLKSLRVMNEHGVTMNNFNLSDPVKIEMQFWVVKPGMRLNPSFQIFNQLGVIVFATTNFHDAQWNDRIYEPGLYRTVCIIPGHLMNEGRYTISALVIRNKKDAHIREEIVSFFVHDDGVSRSGYTGGWIGVVRPLLPWSIDRIDTLPQ
jgi:lipopolysaccharide transport system ATP-binding protein